ncbi:hypothetical protein BSKO_01525 [Bryopsis sp. KO-2023]|nr:hypothetical protein BSKO_01525 [Bryopsis sp. KO-2023]
MANTALTSTPPAPALDNTTATRPAWVETMMTNGLDDFAMPATPVPFAKHSWRIVAAVTTETCSKRLCGHCDSIGALLLLLFLSCLVERAMFWVRKGTKQESDILKKELDALKRKNAAYAKRIDILEVAWFEEKTEKEHLKHKLEKQKESSRLAIKEARERAEVLLEGKGSSEKAFLEKRITKLEGDLLEAKERLRSAREARTRVKKRNAKDVVDMVSVMEVVEKINNGTGGEEEFSEKVKGAIMDLSDMRKTSYLARYCLICLGDFFLKVRDAMMMSKRVKEMERIARVPGVVCVALEKGNSVKEGRYIHISDPRLAEWSIQACCNAEALDIVWCREGFPVPSSSLGATEDGEN